MKCNGTEYRILKNGTGTSFKVEVKDGSFMGFDQWKELRAEYFRHMGTLSGYTLMEKDNDLFCVMEIRFASCKLAKEAAMRFCKEPLKNQWTECKC